ncbi:Rieske 2Fe-2S domain-containing protein [Rhizorhapis sp. SPR117]|uniref:Rieske 2Fe-2S domain-containing protein n=1 Tax=Rhizorhapis sp. SPR117 TaxID=2912611 RepID=UPI001F277947|nr:Rieske 2Fe-2S domain-containing protein [Rhizorhapis sp. SPR117]
MLTQANNDLLTRVEGDAPMGRLIRKWAWLPFTLPSQLKPYGAPLKVRLLGNDYVAWRAPDGTIGFIDQACPHRRVSMALARNEGCALRCIFHGWAVDVSGRVVETPSHAGDQATFAASVKVRSYPTFEGGDMVWVYLGEGEPPERPNLPILNFPEGHVWTCLTKADCNWFQGVEGSLDTAHLTSLHTSWIPGLSPRGKDGDKPTDQGSPIMNARPPVYEIRRTPWGLTAAALRATSKGKTHLRASQFVAPFITMIPAYPYGTGSFFAMVPIDDTHHLLFIGYFAENSLVDENWPPIQMGIANGRCVKENFAPLAGGPEVNYGQNRVAMANGHFSGFPNNLVEEDIVVQASMGAITDRTKENLSSSDVALVQTRMLMLRALKNDAEGKKPLAQHERPYNYREVLPVDAMVLPDDDWEQLLTRERTSVAA